MKDAFRPSIGITGWAQPNLNVPTATEAPADKWAQGAVYHFPITRLRKAYNTITRSMNWYLFCGTKVRLQGLQSLENCFWLAEQSMSVHVTRGCTYYVYQVHTLSSCCHSQTINAYVFVIFNYSNSELQLPSLVTIFSHRQFMLQT